MIAPPPLLRVPVLQSKKRLVNARRVVIRSLLTEIRVLLRFLRGQTLLVIVSQELVKEINGFVGDVPLIVW
mgnify:CR=1 FL=1